MTALYIILSLLLLLFLLLLINVRIVIEYKQELSVKVKYFVFTFPIFNNGKKVKSADSNEGVEKNKQKKDEKGGDTLSSLEDTIVTVKTVIEKILELLGRVKINDLRISAEIHDDDAAACAIKVGAANAIVYSFVGWLSSLIEVKNIDIQISPNYISESDYYLHTVIIIKPIFAVKSGLGLVWAILKNNFKKEGSAK